MPALAERAVELKTTKNFKELLDAWDAGKRRFLMEGGTSSAKTWTALQFLIVLASSWPVPLIISVVSETLPHLKRGAIRDFFRILGESQEDNPNYSKTEFTYTFPTGTQIEFFGADNVDRTRGPRRHILFINECNNVPWESARSLDVRTELFTIADWNPTGEFWAHEFWIPDTLVNAYSHSTYLDAIHVLPEGVVANIESNRGKDPNWWNIYGLGLLGKVEGLVYPGFEQVEALPPGDVFYGLDFGYLVDPSAFVANVIIGDKLYSKELVFITGMDNEQIAREISLCHLVKNAFIFADANEPKSIAEIRKSGYNIQESVKGPGSEKFSHQKVNQYYQHWTKDSVNCIKEQRNFRYIRRRDSTGHEYFSDDTTHQWSHGMSARRFAVAKYEMAPADLYARSPSRRDTVSNFKHRPSLARR